MIEDLQDERYLKRDDKNGNASSIKVFLLFVLIWAVLSSVVVIVFFPQIKATFHQTRALEIISNLGEERHNVSFYDGMLCFIKPENSGTSLFCLYPAEIKRTGESKCHDYIEALLRGLPDSAINDGAVSFIPDKTKLEGLSVSCGTAFVCFSKQFREAPLEARNQVFMTLKAANDKITDVVFLVDGEEI